ncbi:MAG: hypothetical protein BA865_07810 [Desulfobacterales bacterium S5133MH4]|nr:MAG: hypothetical protein BA865_07810 [Desulfobacterales bacterium S5133MH4]
MTVPNSIDFLRKICYKFNPPSRLKPIRAAKEADYLSLDRHFSESIPLAFMFLVLRPKLNVILIIISFFVLSTPAALFLKFSLTFLHHFGQIPGNLNRILSR